MHRETLPDLQVDDAAHRAMSVLSRLVETGEDQLPRPAGGRTLVRWHGLSAVARRDLSLAKLYEGHTDALAILAELDRQDLATPGSRWGVWAAELPGTRAEIRITDRGARLTGTKCWCSGALGLTHGLLTAWSPDTDEPRLVSVRLDHPGITICADRWKAVGMAGAPAVDVTFDDVPATCVGDPGDYLRRPGFWHGGAGVAACWFGGALRIADSLSARIGSTPSATMSDPLAIAAGQVDLSLHTLGALLATTADWIDRHPRDDARIQAYRVRLAADRVAREVVEIVGDALGAGPFCTDEGFARTVADLTVFVRQNHGLRDFAALGRALAVNEPEPTWWRS